MKRPPMSASQTRRFLCMETNLLWFRGGLQPEVLDSLGGLSKGFVCALLLLLPFFLQLPGIHPLEPQRKIWYLETFVPSLTTPSPEAARSSGIRGEGGGHRLDLLCSSRRRHYPHNHLINIIVINDIYHLFFNLEFWLCGVLSPHLCNSQVCLPTK